MNETITRAQWLREEIEDAQRYIALPHTDGDPVAQAQVNRRARELVELRRELARIESGERRTSIHLEGTGIIGNDAPLALVDTIVHRYGQIANEYSADVLIAPSATGSHVINIVGPAQDQFPLDAPDPFAEAALALISMSPEMLGRGKVLEERAREAAALLSNPTFVAIREMMNAISVHNVDAEIDMVSRGRTSKVRIRRQDAQDIETIMRNLSRTVDEVVVEGILRGFTEGSGRFEIESDRPLAGRVPLELRSAAEGIALGDRVRAKLEQVTTTLPSGDDRVIYRLRSIEQIDDGP